MSTIKAHLPVALIFQRVYDSDAIGLPSHRASALKVRQNSLLSYGACSRRPMTGNTHVVIVADESFHS